MDADSTNIYTPQVEGDLMGGASRAWSASNNDYGGCFTALSAPCWDDSTVLLPAQDVFSHIL